MQISKRVKDLNKRFRGKIVDEQPHQSDQRQLKKRRTRLEIFHLPKDVIDIIIFFIPDGYLETYLDIPFIGEYAANRFYRYIEILPLVANTYPLESPYMANDSVEPNKYQTMSIRKTYTSNLPNFLIHPNEDGGSGNTYYRQLSVNEFVQLSKTYPRFQPKVVHFMTLNRFVWMHERYPTILKRLPHIDISFEDRFIFTGDTFFNSQYNIYRVFNIPEEFINKNVFSRISCMCSRGVPRGIGKRWTENLEELYFGGDMSGGMDPTIGQLYRLFPRLKRLCLGARIWYVPEGMPRFPPMLEFLQIRGLSRRTIARNGWNFSYLAYLKEIIVETDFCLDTLRRFKFPPGIERVLVSCESYPELTPRLLNLDGVERYPNLKEFRVRFPVDGQKVFSHNAHFPPNLQKLDIAVERYSGNHPLPLVDLGDNLKLPDNLKVLQLYTNNGFYHPEELFFPPSLEILSLYNEMIDGWAEPYDWHDVLFPDSLVQLNLHVTTTEGLALPKSLRSLNLSSIRPSSYIDFFNLENLVQLIYSYVGMEDFVYKLPFTLKTLDLSSSKSLHTIHIDAPNLKSVLLNETGFASLDRRNFRLPDSVERLSLNNSGLKSTAANSLPRMLKQLCLQKCSLTSDLLDNLQLQDYQNLVKLDLSENRISRLGSNTLPPSLEWLRLDKNPVSTFSNSSIFSDLTRLRELNISRTNINNYLQTNELKFPSSLISLNLAENGLQKGAVGHLILSSCTQLQELCLVGNVDIEDIQEIVDVIKSTCPDMVDLMLNSSLDDCVLKEDFLSFHASPIVEVRFGM
ncbi:uncharacterized protein J8A68_001180 [[Candida] subhashii]|uniref:Uncharacterized protein n=1 Tax=[Candida] subhashii TaxID=561895 RepID=A0A8J5QP58_9ASCO|nr:uncharacterized protein J8A68_001180 [[Candida] subhashii]KAG7665124.1 hypothetical protein J8A68_001180 [[Candida] subhashii]